MRVATWNVNSIRARVVRTVDWLVREDIDVLAMQEIKCKPEQFPVEAFEDAGLRGRDRTASTSGTASRSPAGSRWRTSRSASPTCPGFSKGEEGPDLPREARAMGVTVEGMRLWSLYVPNGRALDDPHYDYKLDWLATLAADTQRWLAEKPDQPLALMGDWNIAPLDSDNGDPTVIPGVSTHVSPPERSAFSAFETIGLTDVVRPLVPEGYTYWDYKQLRFPRNEGLRIDFILGSKPFADLVTGASIHRNERKGEAPSDHVPVVVDLDLEPQEDDDDRPMIFG